LQVDASIAANRTGEAPTREVPPMSPRIIVSYDDTDNDRDALALGRLLAVGGAELSLAYVRHAREGERSREETEQRHAEELLAHGAEAIGAPDVPRHVVVHASTGEGLQELAARQRADVIVFGSEYRTAPGAVAPGTSAQRLLNGGRTAVAIAPADMRSHPAVRIASVGFVGDGDGAAEETASALASALGARIGDPDAERVDFLVIGSRAGAPPGRLELSAVAEYMIETSAAPVLALPRGTPVDFADRAVAAV
jgi:nucleotide-binding universal stress UspA family protein